MDSKVALYFRNEFRDARATALKDAEGYQQILFVLERLGAYLLGGGCCEEHKHKRANGLNAYKKCILALVEKYHPFQGKPPDDYHTASETLYEMVRLGRNDALHQGAVARNLTSHSVQLSLMLEDALMSASESEQIKDYMIRRPVCAEAWQPVSFVRQMMLENSFSYIPVYMKKKRCAEGRSWHIIADIPVYMKKKKNTEEEAWHIIADYHIAEYLRSANSDGRRKLLAKSIEQAIGSGKMTIEEARTYHPDEIVQDVLKRIKGKPILVVKSDNCRELLGIATAFDLM